MIAVLSGGTGTPKFLQGLMAVLDHEEITVIVNTAEDQWLPHGFLSPDIDTVLYTLSGRVEEGTWYGVRGDTFHTHQALLDLGGEEILRIGDRDRAVHIHRGALMKQGRRLSEVVEEHRRAFGVRAGVFPMTDDRVETVIATPVGEMDLHRYLIVHKGALEVKGIKFRGLEEARGCPGAVEAVERADGIIIGPSNPVSSILPIVSIRELKKALQQRRDRTIAISPLINRAPVSGPADRFMEARGISPDSAGVATVYKGLISGLIVDERDRDWERARALGINCYRTDTIMKGLEEKKALARFALRTLGVG